MLPISCSRVESTTSSSPKPGKVVGVLAESDVRRGEHAGAGAWVTEVMSPHVAVLDEHETVRRAANMMQGRNVGCLAVTRNGKLAGIVTVSDLLRLVGKGVDRRTSAARASLHYRVPHRKQHAGRW